MKNRMSYHNWIYLFNKIIFKDKNNVKNYNLIKHLIGGCTESFIKTEFVSIETIALEDSRLFSGALYETPYKPFWSSLIILLNH